MKRLFTLVVLLLPLISYVPALHAQPAAGNDVASLLKTLRASPADTSRSKVYAQLVSYYRAANPDSASYFAIQGLAFTNSINDKKGKEKLLALSGSLDVDKSMFNKAKQEYLDALAIDRSINNKRGMGIDLNNLGQVSISKGDYTSATTYYIEALKLFEEIHFTEGTGAVNMALGMLNNEIGNTDKAQSYLLKAQAIYSTIPFSLHSLQLMNNLGMFYNRINKRDTALKILKAGIAKSTAPEYAFVRAQLLLNAGNTLYKMGKMADALDYTEQSLQLTQQNDLKTSECYALVNIAEIKKDDPELSLAYLKKALAISQEIGEKHLEVGVYDNLAGFYKRQGQSAEALDATEKKDALQDSILDKQKSVEIADLQSSYELEKTKTKVNDLMLINSRDEFKTKLVVAIAAGSILLLIIVGFFFRRTANLNRLLVAQGEELKEVNNVAIAQREELREINGVKDKIFSVLGHDLRSPLSNIIGMLQVIEEDQGVINDEYRPYVSDLRFQSLVTLDTLDKLLYWGKNSFKGIIIQQQAFTIDIIVKSNITLLTAVAQKKNITVTNEIPLGTQVFADISHFDFVTRNLLSNALKYTPEGGSINISIATTTQSGNITFAVHDTGIGMSQEEQDHIFSLDNTSKIGTQEEVGSGIGLLLCKEFVEKNGGKLWVTSTPGEGSTFFFSLKAA